MESKVNLQHTQLLFQKAWGCETTMGRWVKVGGKMESLIWKKIALLRIFIGEFKVKFWWMVTAQALLMVYCSAESNRLHWTSSFNRKSPAVHSGRTYLNVFGSALAPSVTIKSGQPSGMGTVIQMGPDSHTSAEKATWMRTAPSWYRHDPHKGWYHCDDTGSKSQLST